MDRLVARDVAALDGPIAAELITELQAAEDRLTAVRVAAAAVCEADGLWALDGSRTFAQWLARRTGVTVARAKRDARLGRALRDELPGTAAGVREGRVGVEQARILATVAATSGVRREALVADWECNEAFLLQQAETFTADKFRSVVRHWAAMADPDADERGFRDAAAREFLELSRTMGGFHLAGFLTDEHGLALTTALSAVAGVPPAGDDRSTTQRRAQALADLARLTLDHGLVGAGSAVRPHLSVHVTLDQLMAVKGAGVGAEDRVGPSAASAGDDRAGDRGRLEVGTGNPADAVDTSGASDTAGRASRADTATSADTADPAGTGSTRSEAGPTGAATASEGTGLTDKADPHCEHAGRPFGLPAPPWPGGPPTPEPLGPQELPADHGTGPRPDLGGLGAFGGPGADDRHGSPPRPFPPGVTQRARTAAEEQWLRDPYPDEQRRPAPFRRALPTPVTFEDGTPVPKSLLARLACDSEVTRIVFGPDSTVLDLGRAKRTVTGQLRRAVIARDRHCAYPHCTAPPALSEVHHVQHWADGGLTSLINSILLCWHHHDLIHRHAITITRRGNTWVFTDRNGQLIGTTSTHAAA